MSNKLDLDYQNLIKDILQNGIKKSDRTGTGTLSVFSRELRHKMSDGFPLLTTKKMYFKGVIKELKWFLLGETNIKFLLDNDCHIWDGDAYKAFQKEKKELYDYATNEAKNFNPNFTPPPLTYETKEEFIEKIQKDDEFAKKWGDLGAIYGKQWRRWQFTEFTKEEKQVQAKVGYVDQVKNLINDLINNPDSRRLMVNAWNPGELDNCVLPPCHYGFQVYTRELNLEERNAYYTSNYLGLDETTEELNKMNIPKRAISLKFNMRSTDIGLGLPFNIASYGLLLLLIAKKVNMIADELIFSGGDVHLYLNHVEPIKEQLTREPYTLPNIDISDRNVEDISEYDLNDIELENYQSHPLIKLPLSN